MVSKSCIIEIAKQYQSFFAAVLTASASAGDKESASYGLEETNQLLYILDNNENLTNARLKQIHSIFTNMTRGVEYFEDPRYNQKKRELGQELYVVKQAIKNKVKW